MNELIDFFRNEGYADFGHTGDYEGWSPEHTAVHFLKQYIKVLHPPEWPLPKTPSIEDRPF